MNKPKAVFCWSGGKDSAYCLHKVLSENLFDVKYLLTTLNDEFKRISMHGVSEELLDMQAFSIDIPLLKVFTSEGTNQEYEKKMEEALIKVRSENIHYVIFGDIFLDDLRTYRENNLAKLNMTAVFPLWKLDTSFLIHDFIAKGFKTITCCTNDGFLDESWVGKEIDSTFIRQLPPGVDPCGENGEYHTFCYDGPGFKHKIHVAAGKKIYRALPMKMETDCTLPSEIRTKGFWFCDLNASMNYK